MTSDSSHPQRPQSTSISLLQRAKSDDQEAWQRLVRLYGPLVYGWCRRAGLSEDDVADVFQEVFRAVAGGLQKFSPRTESGSFRGWLRTITRSKLATFFGRAGRQPKARGGTEAQLQMGAIADPLVDDGEEEQTSDHGHLVRRALEMVKPDFNEHTWQAFCRVAIEGHHVADVAADLGMSDQAVRQANYRIRRRLRMELEGLLDFEPGEG